MSASPPSDDRPAQITWTRVGDLLGSLPYVLGFQPTESLVMVAVDAASSTLVVVGRVDLPSPLDYRATATGLVASVIAHGPLRIFLVVVAALSGPDVPHRALIEACTGEFERAGLPMIGSVVGSVLHSRGSVAQLQRPGRLRPCPDPATTSQAAQSVLAGRVTYASRDEMAAQLAPAPDDVLARRAALMASMAAADRPHTTEHYRRFCEVDRAVRRARGGDVPATDDEVARLTLALRDHTVRDACLSYTEGEFREGAETLWRSLVQAVPGPDCAEPAVLLALCAYLRGDGVFAQIAVQRAHEANSAHRLAAVIAEALACGMPPEKLRHIVIRTGLQALDDVMKSAP